MVLIILCKLRQPSTHSITASHFLHAYYKTLNNMVLGKSNAYTSASIQMPCIHIMLAQMKACGENLTQMTNVFALCLQPDLTRPEKRGSAHGPVSSHKSHVLTPKNLQREIFYTTCHDKTGIFSDGMDHLHSILYEFIIALFIFGFGQK